MPKGRERGQCTVPACGRSHQAHGYCHAHLRRLQKHGDVLAHLPIRRTKDHPLTEKRCTRCGVLKPIAAFTADRYSPAGRVHSYCKDCSKELRKQRVESLLAEVTQHKLDRGCADCGYRAHPMALHFDHLPGEVKLFNIGVAVHRLSPLKIWAEIAKCEVVCANCHAVRTAERMGYARA